MTPAERLRAAADRLAALDAGATPGPWTVDEQLGRDWTGEGWSSIVVLAPPVTQVRTRPPTVAECALLDRCERARENADLIAALRPLAPIIAEQLRCSSVQAGNITKDPNSRRLWHDAIGCGGEVGVTCDCFADALALADTVRGATS